MHSIPLWLAPITRNHRQLVAGLLLAIKRNTGHDQAVVANQSEQICRFDSNVGLAVLLQIQVRYAVPNDKGAWFLVFVDNGDCDAKRLNTGQIDENLTSGFGWRCLTWCE